MKNEVRDKIRSVVVSVLSPDAPQFYMKIMLALASLICKQRGTRAEWSAATILSAANVPDNPKNRIRLFNIAEELGFRIEMKGKRPRKKIVWYRGMELRPPLSQLIHLIRDGVTIKYGGETIRVSQDQLLAVLYSTFLINPFYPRLPPRTLSLSPRAAPA